MTQLADENLFPFSPLCSITPPPWSCGVRLGKVPPSDVAQPSVVELAWFNAAGTRVGYCAWSCSAAGSRQKPHCESLWREANGAKFVGIVRVYRGEKEEAGGLRRGSPQSSSLIKIFNTSERPCFDSLKEHRDRKRGQTADCTPWKRGGEEKKRRGEEAKNKEVQT